MVRTLALGLAALATVTSVTAFPSRFFNVTLFKDFNCEKPGNISSVRIAAGSDECIAILPKFEPINSFQFFPSGGHALKNESLVAYTSTGCGNKTETVSVRGSSGNVGTCFSNPQGINGTKAATIKGFNSKPLH